MADKELRRLKRRELLQMLLVQCEETERLQNELDKTNAEFMALQEGYERLKKKLDVKDERLNQKDAKIAELNSMMEEMQASRVIELEEAGSIAEAALRLNGIFEAAQRCAEQYLMNVKRIGRNTFDKQTETEQMPLMEDTLPEIPERLAVPGQTAEPAAFTITERRAARGQRIPFESARRPAARRKKLHG